MNLSDLRRLLANTNVAAFLRVIRERESSQDESAYTVLNGGARFFSFAAHPYKGQRTPPGKAAGAYQFIASTWGDVEQQYGMPDFSPASQDAGAVARLVYRGALEDVMAGRFEQAVTKCRLEWTSLPGAAESSGAWTMDKALAVFRKWGGRTAAELAALRPGGAPTPTPQPPAKAGQPNQREGARTMSPLLATLIPGLVSAVVQRFAPAERATVEQTIAAAPTEDARVAIANTILGVLQAKTGLTDPVQAVAAVTAETPAAAAKLAEVQEATMLKLSEVAGFLGEISKLQDASAKRTEESRGNARAFNLPEAWRLRWAQVTFAQKALTSASVISALLIAIMTVSLIWIPQDARSAVLNLLGQLVIVLVTTIGLLGATLRDQNGFSFGGTSSDNAAEMAREELAARRQGAKQ